MSSFNLDSFLGTYYSTTRTACTLSKEITSQLIDTFLQTIYISNYLTHEIEFISRINASIYNFKVFALPTIIHLLQLILDTTQGNQLLTSTFTNAELQYNASSTIEDNEINIVPANLADKSCSCSISSDSCQILHSKYCNNTYNALNGICFRPALGMYLACYLLNGVLQTSLECFYNAQCLVGM